ncbi:MAG: endonuclease V [Planctomycetaceae bacterium]|nr:endonuclease V [Planctomycetaceae bacterium]
MIPSRMDSGLSLNIMDSCKAALLDLPFVIPDLVAEVNSLLDQIPRGSISTYGDLARALGDEKARSARWLGEFLKNHSCHAECHCHRVVRVNGEIGRHVSGDPQVKIQLLRSEGVPVSDLGIADMTRCTPHLHSSSPLTRLREYQHGWAKQVRFDGGPREVRSVAAVDVAYRPDGTAQGAYVQMDFPSLTVLREMVLRFPVVFPYIPGYLTFRELPVMLSLCEQARRENVLGDVIFVDGNGTLHPWRAGIATCLGVLLDHPVVGVGKSLLCGKVDLEEMSAADTRPVVDQGETLANAIKSKEDSRPIFVSAGHRMTLTDATRLARQSMTGHRLPEPIHHADRLTRQPRKVD